MFDKIKTLLVERNIECPMCGEKLSRGDVLFEDEYRGDTFCAYCADEHENNILLEEGENGKLLK